MYLTFFIVSSFEFVKILKSFLKYSFNNKYDKNGKSKKFKIF